MLFVVEYEFGWDDLDSAVAKRLEWADAQPDDFHFVGEYVWQDADPPFRGVIVVEVGSVESLNALALHYGPTLKMRVHPASDVMAGISQLGAGASPAPRSMGKKR